MSTAAQAAANFENAKHSTGPRTEAGKSASSQNALKHGLTANTVLLPGEDEAAYRKLCQGIFQVWDPAHETEIQLIQHVCDTQWRINRCARLEAAVLNQDIPDFKALDIISKHEARLKKLYSTSLKQAEELIFRRVTNREARLKEAMLIRRADKLKERPTNFQEIGFDLSTREVDAAINLEDTILKARKVVSQNANWSK